jgi:hypothetical protein
MISQPDRPQRLHGPEKCPCGGTDLDVVMMRVIRSSDPAPITVCLCWTRLKDGRLQSGTRHVFADIPSGLANCNRCDYQWERHNDQEI